MFHFKPAAVGYACCYVPAEIIMAAGFEAERMVPAGRCADAEGYVHPNTCCFIKSMLGDAAKGAYSHLSAVVLANSCDGMRRACDVWNAFIDQPKAIFLDVPKKQGPDPEMYLTSLLKRLGSRLSSLPGGKPATDARLKDAIRQVNEIRAKYLALFESQEKGRLSGSDVFPFLTCSPGKEHGKNTEPAKSPPHGLRKRIFITGNMMNNPALVTMIESYGGTITGFDTCFGKRHYELQTDEKDPDPWQAVARRYLSRPQCARMMGIENQVACLERVLAEARPGGVIISRVKFCDNLSFNVPHLQAAIEAAGARCLVLENDYEWSDAEKMRIKVEAFLETMG